MIARVAAPVRKTTVAPAMCARAPAMSARVAAKASFGSVKAFKAAARSQRSAIITALRVFAEEGAVQQDVQVYVGNISWNTTEDDLVSAFSDFGTVTKCNVVMDQDGRSRGFAFVTYPDENSAMAAIDGLNNQDLDGRTIRVDKVLPPGERPERKPREARPAGSFVDSPYRIYVGNLPWRFDDYDLEDAFAEFGEVADAKVMYDRESGRSRGFGFVTLNSDEEVDAAINALDGADVNGRAIRVNRAAKRE